MTSARTSITLHLEPMRRFRALVQAGLGGGGGGAKGPSAPAGGPNPFEEWRNQAARRYSSFSVARFNAFSRGGGDWPALAISTIKARTGAARGREGKGGGSGGGKGARFSLGRETYKGLRRRGVSTYDAKRLAGTLKQVAGRTVSILTDTGTLKRAVGVDGAGHRTTRLSNGIQYGFEDVPHGTGRFAAIARRRADLAKKFSKKKRLTLGTKEATDTIRAARRRGELLAAAPKGRKGGVRSSALTIGQLATIHHFGTKTIPARPILVEPSPAVVASIANDLSSAVRKAIALSKTGGAA